MRNLTPYDVKKLKKKMKKLERDFDLTEGQPLAQARIEKSARSVQARLDVFK